jgi:hypothetical protein
VEDEEKDVEGTVTEKTMNKMDNMNILKMIFWGRLLSKFQWICIR